MSQLALSGAGAGAFASFLLTPIELVKCKMQVQMLAAERTMIAGGDRPAFRSLPGPISVFMTILRTHGVRGLWLGQTGTFVRETGGCAAWFATNEWVARFFIQRRGKQEGRIPSEMSKKDLGPVELALAGAAAGIMYNLSLFPADSVKSAIQTEEELRPRGSTAPRATFWGMFKDMYRAGGIKALYAGCGITVARAAPSSAMIFLIYDGLSKRFG